MGITLTLLVLDEGRCSSGEIEFGKDQLAVRIVDGLEGQLLVGLCVDGVRVRFVLFHQSVLQRLARTHQRFLQPLLLHGLLCLPLLDAPLRQLVLLVLHFVGHNLCFHVLVHLLLLRGPVQLGRPPVRLFAVQIDVQPIGVIWKEGDLSGEWPGEEEKYQIMN